MSLEEKLEKSKNLLDIPIPQLSREDYFIAVTIVLLEEAKMGAENLSYRYWLRYMDIQPLIKKYSNELDEIFKKYGYFRVSTLAWRRLKIESLKVYDAPLESIMRRLNVDEDSAYIIYCSYKLLQKSILGLRDWIGLNRVHTLAFYDRLRKKPLTTEDINWLNERLLKYREQLSELGLDYKRVEERLRRVKP